MNENNGGAQNIRSRKYNMKVQVSDDKHLILSAC